MKKMTRSSKKGFTLAEIILVVAIIVIVSAAAFVGIGSTINNANNTTKKLEEENGENFEADAWGEVKSITEGAADFFDIPFYTPEDEEPEAEGPEDDEEGESGGGTSGGTSGGSVTPESRPPTPTPVPTATPTPKPAGGSGAVSYNGPMITRGTAGSGVMSIAQNADGSTTVGLLYSQWNDGSVRIWKNADGSYDIQGVNNGINVIGNALASKGVSFDWNPINNNQRFRLTPDMKNALSSLYGISFN